MSATEPQRPPPTTEYISMITGAFARVDGRLGLFIDPVILDFLCVTEGMQVEIQRTADGFQVRIPTTSHSAMEGDVQNHNQESHVPDDGNSIESRNSIRNPSPHPTPKESQPMSSSNDISTRSTGNTMNTNNRILGARKPASKFRQEGKLEYFRLLAEHDDGLPLDEVYSYFDRKYAFAEPGAHQWFDWKANIRAWRQRLVGLGLQHQQRIGPQGQTWYELTNKGRAVANQAPESWKAVLRIAQILNISE